MAPKTYNFTTGPSSLPGAGTLSYNGCVFSPLFATTVSGKAIKDEAQRTVKYMEYTITADGYVTLPDGEFTTANVMYAWRQLLYAQGGLLIYTGRGCDIIVNSNVVGGNNVRDMAWGPIPEVLEFQPMGAGRSAMVKFQVTTRIPEVPLGPGVGGLAGFPLLQLNYDTNVGYGEDGFSILTVSGTLEVPLWRRTQTTRTLTGTADDLRGVIEARIMDGIDLSRFRMTRRDFALSRDKRTLTWNFIAEEVPYQQMPPGATIARGSYSVRPAQSGMGLCNWLCTLRCTYTIRKDFPRRQAWFEFVLLLRHRMIQAQLGVIPKLKDPDQNPPKKQRNSTALLLEIILRHTKENAELADRIFQGAAEKQKPAVELTTRPMLIDFNVDEGLYLDSKTVTFSATWRFVTAFSQILIASGIWRKASERLFGPQLRANAATPPNLWAINMVDIQGAQSWLVNKVDPALDVIVDFGS